MVPSAKSATWKARQAVASGLALSGLFSIIACAQVPADPEARLAYDQADDPIEPANRVIFSGNQFVDRNALRPVSRAYANNVPDRARKSIHNFVSNLGEPVIAVNDVLQGNFHRAANTTGRFFVNTTVGGVGLFDVATDWDMPYHSADLGQTLGVWGVPPGPSVQLPLFGPSNVRDTVGKAGGLLANPFGLAHATAVSVVNGVDTGLGVVDGRADLLPTTDTLERNSLDYYATLRSLAAQRRAALVAEGKAGGRPGAPDIDTTQPLPDVTPRPAAPQRRSSAE